MKFKLLRVIRPTQGFIYMQHRLEEVWILLTTNFGDDLRCSTLRSFIVL